MNTSELVQPRHLNGRAVIYVRQSSPNQVITNKESQRMQYALRERAAALGWHEQDIQVIDTDLGRSGATTDGRAGYQELVARIALGEVGILLALAGWSLSRTFELSTIQAVQQDKVHKLERYVEKLQDQMDDMQDSDKEIMDQHEQLFKKLEQSNTGYSYN